MKRLEKAKKKKSQNTVNIKAQSFQKIFNKKFKNFY